MVAEWNAKLGMRDLPAEVVAPPQRSWDRLLRSIRTVLATFLGSAGASWRSGTGTPAPCCTVHQSRSNRCDQ
jgi:hypothetical protein